MSDSLDIIKSYKSIDLDNFVIRGVKFGINNARTTGVLYDTGTFVPFRSVFTGRIALREYDSTADQISFNPPMEGLSALDLQYGDRVIIGETLFNITSVLDNVRITIDPVPSFTGIVSDATYSLRDRDYLIEPDSKNNTISTGLARFSNGSCIVDGLGTNWLSDLAPGDAIQCNSYQKYFIIDQVLTSSRIILKSPYTGSDTDYVSYTAKKWRLDRLTYQFIKNNFRYDNQLARWTYDSTTESNKIATSYFSLMTDGISLKFSRALKPSQYPDLMDSNTVLRKVLARSTVNDMFEFPLPAVPKPEESFQLYINGDLKTKGVDYVINYSQIPVYISPPPPVEERTVANLMFLKRVRDVTLDPSTTQSGVLVFSDQSGNRVTGVLQGTESILVDSTPQKMGKDYIIDGEGGVGYATEVVTNEPVVKYIAYQKTDLYENGLKITLNGKPQKITVPGNPSDDVLFDLESGRLKPIDKDNPAPGEEYIVSYYVKGDYISNEIHTVSDTTNVVRVKNPPIGYQSLIVMKNGRFLTEDSDYRVSYFTGRVVFFSSLKSGDIIDLSYSSLVKYINGITSRDVLVVYKARTSVASTNPITINFPDTSLLLRGITPKIRRIFNLTKNAVYSINGYSYFNTLIKVESNVQNISIGTESSDTIEIDYEYQHDGVEHTPIEIINFSVVSGTNYMAIVGKDARNLIPSGTFVRLTNVDSAGDYFFKSSSTTYDGEDTVVYFSSIVPVDFINPTIYLTDSSNISFIEVPNPDPVASGSTKIIFKGNLLRTFRIGQLLNLGNDYYYITNVEYDRSTALTTVTISVPTYQDYADTSGTKVSDVPIYYEGETLINTRNPIVSSSPLPVMSLNFDGYAILKKDSTSLTIDIGDSHYTFLDGYIQKLWNLAGSMTTLGFSVELFAPDWFISKVHSFSEMVVTRDSSSVLSAIPALRRNGIDTTDFSVEDGLLLLTNPLVPGQRYNLDYIGRRFLGDSTVVFSGQCFTALPKGSKIEASMCYENIDQFYIQVMSQRDFLGSVTQPRKTEEALQESGSVGQGGDIPEDSDSEKSQGGIVGDEFRRVDASIECGIFKNIFDFYNNRLQAYGTEVRSMLGWKLCNNDGPISEKDQIMGTFSYNRMFPYADYTNFEPFHIAALTGETFFQAGSGLRKPVHNSSNQALFIHNQTGVSRHKGTSYWTHQLRAGDYIRPFSDSTYYQIAQVVSDSSLSLATPYLGSTIGQSYVVASSFPLYDDDGYTGPKIIGFHVENYGIVDGDLFDATIDGVPLSYEFEDPGFPLNVLFPLSKLTGQDIARILTFSRLITSYEWVFDSSTVYGYDNVLVLRADGTYNKIELGYGSAVSKLGFVPGTIVTGNNDNTGVNPEFVHLTMERSCLAGQLPLISNSLSIPNKLARPESDAAAIRNYCMDEVSAIYNEIHLLEQEIEATERLKIEPSMAGYTDNLNANSYHKSFLLDSSYALVYNESIVSNYQGHITPKRWLVNLTKADTTAVRGKYFGVGVPYSSGTDVTSIVGQTSFIIQTGSDNDRRILSDMSPIDGVYFPPSIVYQDTGSPVDGSYTGFNSNGYSDGNQVTFHLNSVPLFYLKFLPATFYLQVVPSDYLSLTWASYYTSFSFSDYTTIAGLREALNNVPGLQAVSNPAFDEHSPNELVPFGPGVLAPTVILMDSTGNTLLTVTNDNIYDFRYSVDNSGIDIIWDSSHKYYSYNVYSTIVMLKMFINYDIPGLDATGSTEHDYSTSRGLKIESITAIPPDGTIFSGLRECTVNFWTIDDKNLIDRNSFDLSRINLIDNRLAYLPVRMGQIRSAITNEEYFRSIDGGTGNLYDWADNRFNRSVGCEAKLKQIEKMMQMSASSLQVNKRFL